MGSFIEADYVKTRSRVDEVKEMEHEDIEDLLIKVAESILEVEYDLDLDTDAQPRRWSGIFQNRADKLSEFQSDMKVATLLLIDRIALNPHEYSSQSVRGASVSYGKKMPSSIDSLMQKWGQSSSKSGRLIRSYGNRLWRLR